MPMKTTVDRDTKHGSIELKRWSPNGMNGSEQRHNN